MPAGEIPNSISEEGKVPERFSNASQVIQLAAQMVGADQRRAPYCASLERLRSGEPVYPLEKLRQANQSWRARTNYRGLEGIISTENTLDYDLQTQGEGLVDISLDFGMGFNAPSSAQVQDWEWCMEKEFKWLMMTRWSKGFNYAVCKRNDQKNLFGIGMHFWPDTTGNWIPRTPYRGEVLFPDNCPFNFDDEGDYFMTRDYVPSYVLYRKIQNRKEATALGWDVDIVWKALCQLSKAQNQNQYGDVGAERLARHFSQGDIGYWSTLQSGVWIDSVFCREYETGKVSQYCTAEGLSLNDYLYKKRNKYDNWPLEIFPYDIGNGNIHSVKGLGARMKEYFEMMNRVQNAAVDQVMISSYPSMKQTIQNMDPDKMKLAKIGGFNWLPYGAEPQILEFPNLNNGPLALMDRLERTNRDNNHGVNGSAEIEQQDRMTGREYADRSQDINHLSTGAVMMQKARLDSFYNRIVRLCAKPSASKQEWAVMALEWRERCMKRGVPKEAFENIAEVKAVIAYGKGSASARTSAYRELFASPVYAAADMPRQIAIQRGFVASLLGPEGVAQYCRNVDDQDVITNGESFAVQENNALAQGGEAVASSEQDQVQHLTIHFEKIVKIVQAYKEGQMEPQPAYDAAFAFGAHIKQHLDFLAMDPMKKEVYQQFYNQWQALAGITDKMRADIESAQEATPPEQQVSEKLQIGMANVQAQQQVNMAKAQASALIKQQQQAHREFMDQQSLNARRAQDNAKTAHQIQTSTVTTAATIAQDAAKTQADIKAKEAKAKIPAAK